MLQDAKNICGGMDPNTKKTLKPKIKYLKFRGSLSQGV